MAIPRPRGDRPAPARAGAERRTAGTGYFASRGMAPWRPGENSRRPSLRAGDRGPARPLARSSPSRGRCRHRDRFKARRWRPSAASPRCHGGTVSPLLPERSMPRRASPPDRRGQTMAAGIRPPASPRSAPPVRRPRRMRPFPRFCSTGSGRSLAMRKSRPDRGRQGVHPHLVAAQRQRNHRPTTGAVIRRVHGPLLSKAAPAATGPARAPSFVTSPGR